MPAQTFGFPTLGTVVQSSARLLAIDDYSLPFRHNVCLYLSRPRVRQAPVLTPSRDNPTAPDHLAAHFYGTVLHEGGRFRLWYYSVSHGDQPGTLSQGPMCYAESDDGIEWVKPILGQVEFKGSRHNNAMALPDTLTEGITLIRDDDDPDPNRRYKLLANCKHPVKSWSVRAATSADGIHWTANPQIPINNFLEQASFYKHQGLYIVNAQSIAAYARGEGGNPVGRTGFVWVSADFDHWQEAMAESFALPEPRDPAERGSRKPYDQVHLGVGAASFGNVCVGLYGMWHHRENFHEIACDLGLVVSQDGLHFREPIKGHVYIATADSSATPLDGVVYPTVLCQSNGILNVGDETRIYHGRWRNARYGNDYYAETALATLPRDRWGGLGLYPEHASGEVWSAPIQLPTGPWGLSLNAEGLAGVRVEVADEGFRPFPAFAAENSGDAGIVDGLDKAVTWPQGDLSRLSGERVRLKLTLTRQGEMSPKVYAVYLNA